MSYYERKWPEKQAAYNAEKCKDCPRFSEKCIEIARFEAEHKSRTNHAKRDSLCWCCKKAVPKPEDDIRCPWAEEGIPVKGWDAYGHKTAAGELHYSVKDCPLFERGIEAEECYDI